MTFVLRGIGGHSLGGLVGQGGSTQARLVLDGAGAVVGVQKQLVPRLRADALARSQLRNEAIILGALSGRGAPRLLAAEDADPAGAWLVMEHLPLPTLGSHAATLPPEERAAFIASVAEAAFRALAAVHEAADERGPLSVVHGDVSPENLLVAPDGAAAALVDFGLARSRDTAAAPAEHGALRGTARYLAPEVARGEPATVRSDVFSLGLALLHAASGEPPRTSAALAPLVLEAGEQPVVEYAERASAPLSPSLRVVLLAVVAFDPQERPVSAREAWRHAGGTESW